MRAPKVTPGDLFDLTTALFQPDIETDRESQIRFYRRTSYAQGKAELLAPLAELFYWGHIPNRNNHKGFQIKAREAASSDMARVILARSDLFTAAQVERVKQYGVGYSPGNLKKRVNHRCPKQVALVENNSDLTAGLTPEHY
jgi:hypothetical protein